MPSTRMCVWDLAEQKDMGTWGFSICRHLSTAIRSATARRLVLCKQSSLSPSNTHTWRWKPIRNTVVRHANQVLVEKQHGRCLRYHACCPPPASGSDFGIWDWLRCMSKATVSQVEFQTVSLQFYWVLKVYSSSKENTYIRVLAKLTRKIFWPKKELKNDPLKSTVKLRI